MKHCGRVWLTFIAIIIGWFAPVKAIGPEIIQTPQSIIGSEFNNQRPVVEVFLKEYRANAPPTDESQVFEVIVISPERFALGLLVVDVTSTHSARYTLHLYAGGDPVNRWDPWGLYWQWNEQSLEWDWIRFGGERLRNKDGTWSNQWEKDDGPDPGHSYKPSIVPTNAHINDCSVTLRATNHGGFYRPTYLFPLERRVSIYEESLIRDAGSRSSYIRNLDSIFETYFTVDSRGVEGDMVAAFEFLDQYAAIVSAPEPPPLAAEFNGFLDDLQTTGDFAGQIPTVGVAIDLGNAGISLLRGQWTDAAERAAFAVPVGGNAAAAKKNIKHGADALNAFKHRIDFLEQHPTLGKFLENNGGLSGTRFDSIIAAQAAATPLGKARALAAGGFTREQRRHLIENYLVCFPAGTFVLTQEGNIAIEDIKIGDFVWSKNKTTKESGYKEIVRLFRSKVSELIEFDIVTQSGVQSISCTKEHPIWLNCLGSWIEAANLTIGNEVELSSGRTGLVRQVKFVKLAIPVVVYNFEVKDWHTYFVAQGVDEEGLLVHNVCAGKHHMFMRSLGNLLPYGHKALTHLNAADHTAVHAALKIHLLNKTKTVGGKVVDMMPRRGNPGSTVQSHFDLEERMDAFDEFYRTFQGGKFHQNYLDEVEAALSAGLLK